MTDRPSFEPPDPPPPEEAEPVEPEILVEADLTWALLAYLGVFAFGCIAPLVVYLARRNRSSFVRFHAAQALNLALSALVVFLAGASSALVTFGVGLVVAVPVIVAQAGYLIMAAVRVGRRERYRIPALLCWPVVR